jgi:hypothetical protein
MKTNKLIIGGLALSFLFAGCKKDSSSTGSNAAVSTVDVASAVSANLATNGYGVVSQLQDAASLTSAGISTGGSLAVSAPLTHGIGSTGIVSAAYEAHPKDTLPCGFTKKINFSVSDSSSFLAFSHTVKYYFMVNCTNSVRTGLTFSDSSSGHFNGPRLISNTVSDGNLTISGLQKTDSTLTYTGSITHSGSYQSKVNDSIAFNSTIVMNLENTLVSKTTHEVVGGTSSITISGVNKKKVPFSYTGTIEFIGGRKAKIKINNDTYTFNLVTGDLDK